MIWPMLLTDRDVHSRILNPSEPVPNYGIKMVEGMVEVCLDALLQRHLCMNVSALAFLMQ